MESNTLVVRLLYGKDIRTFNFFQKLSIYAVVSIVTDDDPNTQKLQQNQQHRTPTDKEGDADPEWNLEVRFDLSEISLRDCDHVFLHFDLYHEGAMFGDKHIGQVRVPLLDLAQQDDGVVRFLSYQVKNPEGKANGVLSFSYRLHGTGENAALSSISSAISGYSIVHHPNHEQGQSPPVEFGFPASEMETESSSPRIQYPTIEMDSEPAGTYSAPHGSYYPPTETYYPPPSMLPPPPPPPPPPVYGTCYYPAHQHPFGPWQGDPRWRAHSFGDDGRGHWRGFGHGGAWQRDRSASFWNGR